MALFDVSRSSQITRADHRRRQFCFVCHDGEAGVRRETELRQMPRGTGGTANGAHAGVDDAVKRAGRLAQAQESRDANFQNVTRAKNAKRAAAAKRLSAAELANDVSIDGNTIRDSHSVPLEHWQPQAPTGVSFNAYRRAFLVSTTIATDRYEGQKETTQFGALSVTYNR